VLAFGSVSKTVYSGLRGLEVGGATGGWMGRWRNRSR